ncbi:MAG: tetratricopeptide repeat protein, partial [Myxococcales bacterium]|nr:tetratricopeptide repeat protein [Myxococcales bacterium]
MRVAAWGATDPGRRRSRNEDAFGVLEADGVLVVADGMGGQAAGEIASKRAIEINPNFSAAFAELGRKYALLGQPEEAIQACQTALRLNPRDPTNFEFHTSLAMAYFVAGDD